MSPEELSEQGAGGATDAQRLREENERLRARLEDLRVCIEELRARLAEPEDIVRAIRQGEVDAFVVSEAYGERIYSLRRADLLYRAMIEEMQEGAVALDPAGTILYCNAFFATLVGAEGAAGRASLIGTKVMQFVPDDSRDFFEQTQRKHLTGTERRELLLRARNGEPLPVMATMNRLYFEENEVLCLIVTDLTKQRREEQLLIESRRKDEFLAMLAHELRNPIAPIRNAAEVLRVAGIEPPRSEWARQVIERQVAHMTRLIDDLLDISRITRGKIRLEREPIELGPVIARAVETARPLIEASHHELSVNQAEGPLWVEGDATRLSQAISNVLNNAAKFTPERGRIWLSLERQDRWVRIAIRDNGIGIAPEMLPRIFDAFTQADSTLGRSQGGLGIGLTLARTLVEMHGGAVSASSAGVGQGSEIVLRLPLSKASVDRAPSEKGTTEPGRQAAGVPPRRILIVDDNEDAAETMAVLLQQQVENDVHIAADGEIALEKARELRPDVMFIDIGLPGMSGYELARHLRAVPELAKTVLVAVTGYGQEQDRRASREAGFDQHWVKPLKPGAMLAFVAELPAPSLRSDTGALR